METERPSIRWDDVIKKEARGINDYDLGEVQEVTSNSVLTEKGLIDTKLFEIPRSLAVEFDGHKLVFNVTENDAKNMYLKATSSSSDDISHESQETVPLIEERLEPKKKEIIEDATIIKEPIKENKEIEVTLTHEELVLERRPLAEPQPTDENPVESRTEIKIPLKREEIQSTKQSYVKEEVLVSKKPVTETHKISEEVTNETIKEE
ncbi:MAG TPA: YsnF/AvaK domain-containing protein [Thermodesulfobacteriota bacterium]|jgi:uncharacterized protein (TIGR02271 family)